MTETNEDPLQVSKPESALQRRAKDQLPTVLLTLLSIVQALALELMWSHVVSERHLYSWSLDVVLEWAQIVGTLLGVLLVWLIYSSMVMRFRWIPTTGDLLFPFVVGIIQFSMISFLGEAQLGEWFLSLALIFAAVAWSSQVTLRRARLDGENHDYFADVPPATFRDFLPTVLVVLGFVITGGYLWISADRGALALLAVLGAGIVITVQTWMSSVFWSRSVGLRD